jgi:tRNA nucleotidyltransferase (CCA-adding enzyme)
MAFLRFGCLLAACPAPVYCARMVRIPSVVRRLAAVFSSHERRCYLVGGAIRDLSMGRSSSDFDIATDALPADVMGMFHHVIPTGLKHGTVTVLFQGTHFEVTTFRVDAKYSDGRRPDSVTFAPTIEEDLARRDFTINAMAYDLHRNQLIDPYGGRADLAVRLLRAIGDPDARFQEDGLRPMRACRFSAQLEFTVSAETRAAIPRALDVVAMVSVERIRDEVMKLLEAPRPSVGFELMCETGLLDRLLPELAEGVGIVQGGEHCFDVFRHGLAACDAAPPADPLLRLASLLHDVGKPRARLIGKEGLAGFHGHEIVSAEMVQALMLRLKFPTLSIRRVTHLVRHHMFNYREEWSDAAVRRFLARIGEENVPDLLELRIADVRGMCADRAVPVHLANLCTRIRDTARENHALTVRELAVSGNDLMAALGIGPGPAVGTVLGELLQSVLDDPALNERGKLLEMAGKLYRERLGPV